MEQNVLKLSTELIFGLKLTQLKVSFTRYNEALGKLSSLSEWKSLGKVQI